MDTHRSVVAISHNLLKTQHLALTNQPTGPPDKIINL